VNFTYGKDKKVRVEKALAVARTAFCNPADNSVKIDGHLDEAFWRDPAGTFFTEDGGLAATDPSEFYFAYDKDNLYLAAKLTDRKIDSMKAAVTEQDGPVYGEDCIGYFLSPHEYRDTIYQFYFNFLGTVYDHKIWKRADGEMDYARDFNGEYEIKATKDSDIWTIEIRVPVSAMGLAGIKKGDQWEVNFRRKQPRLSAAADWQVPIGYPDYKGGWLIMR
ncbi:MAG: carbohydrate-binding family 9-like protein, partial [candidate division Zixibacteria bacterium]|nr:carbohydrate-binding family 9-like protein [candidate division Zixibacteria bacterium]